MKSMILIIDDEELICKGLSRILNKRGYVVDVAPDEISALQLLREKEYDLILLDINLPGTSGIDLLPKIRCVSPDSLITMITVNNDVSLEREAMKAGAHNYCIKSSDHNELLIEVEKAMKTKNLLKNI